MEINYNSTNLKNSFSKLLDEYDSNIKPISLNDNKRLISIVACSINTAHSIKEKTNDLSFFTHVESSLKPYKIDITVQEFAYVSAMLEQIVKPIIENLVTSQQETDNSADYTA